MARVPSAETVAAGSTIRRPLLSVIVTSYTLDRLGDIKELLDSLQAQTYPHIEIIIVAERTLELQQKIKGHIATNHMSNAKVVFNHGVPSLARARNIGIDNANGAIIAFIDDDAVAFPDWAQEIVRTYLGRPDVAGVTGTAIPAWEHDDMQWLPKEFYWLISCTAWFDDRVSSEIRTTRNVWGMNMSFRREAVGDLRFAFGDWAAQGGNKLGLEADDTELSLAVHLKTGQPIVFNPQVRVVHKVFRYRLSRWFIRQKAFCQGYSKAVLKHRHPNLDMGMEHTLLRRMLLGFFPRVLLEFPRQPMTSWKRFWLGFYALFSLALGYLSGRYPRLGGPIVRLYWK